MNIAKIFQGVSAEDFQDTKENHPARGPFLIRPALEEPKPNAKLADIPSAKEKSTRKGRGSLIQEAVTPILFKVESDLSGLRQSPNNIPTKNWNGIGRILSTMRKDRFLKEYQP